MSLAHRNISHLFNFFRLFGFCLINPNSSSTFIHNILNLLNILLESILLYLCYAYARLMFDFSHTIGLVVDVLQIVAPIITHLVCLVDGLQQRKRLANVWREFHSHLLLPTKDPLHQSVIRVALEKYLWMVLPSFLLCTGIELWILCNASAIWFRSRAVGQWAFISCRVAVLFFLLHVALVRSLAEVMVDMIREAARASRSQRRSKALEMKQRKILRNVVECRKSYGRLFRMCQELSYCFGWPLVCQLVYSLMAITIALYYNYRRAVLGVLVVESVLVWVPLLLLLLATFYCCECALRPLHKLPYHLHRIQSHVDDEQLQRETAQFSLQLHHQRIHLNVRGLFNLDFQLLNGIAASIAVYLMIIIQFMPHNDQSKSVNLKVYE